MGARHPILSNYAAEVARVDLMAGDTYAALEHYQQALLLIQSSVGMYSLEASVMYYEMAAIKQQHSHSHGQLEAEEGLLLAEKALNIREKCALKKVGSSGSSGSSGNSGTSGNSRSSEASEESKAKMESKEEEMQHLRKAMEMSTDIHIVGALSTVKGSINDMLVHSYRQVAEMASGERKYLRAMECYERLVVCLRARPLKTEVTLQLMQQATREIINIKMIELNPSVAEKVRKLHALHDPHKKLHEQNKKVFVKVIQTVMQRSAGEYFEELMRACHMYLTLTDDDAVEEQDANNTHPTSPIELACLVELSNSV